MFSLASLFEVIMKPQVHSSGEFYNESLKYIKLYLRLTDIYCKFGYTLFCLTGVSFAGQLSTGYIIYLFLNYIRKSKDLLICSLIYQLLIGNRLQ